MPKRSISEFNPTGLDFDGRFYSAEDVGRIIEAVGSLPDTNVEHERLNEDGSGLVTVSVGRREALAERLESAAKWWDEDSQYQTEPTPKQLADAFEKIQKAAEDLRKALCLPAKPKIVNLIKKGGRPAKGVVRDEIADMPQALRFGGLQTYAATKVEYSREKQMWTGAGRLREAVRGVYQLRNWAGAAKMHNKAEGITPRDSRNAGDAALDKLFGSLADIYWDIFERRVTTSVGPSGSANPRQATGAFVHFIHACLTPLLKDDTPSLEDIRNRHRKLCRARQKPVSN